MNENQIDLKNGIFNYLDMESSGALLVSGSWGCGKSYFFENTLFGKLREEGYKPIRVSLFGMCSLNDLVNDIAIEFVMQSSKTNCKKSIASIGLNLIKHVKEIPYVKDYIDLKGFIGNTKVLYRLIPEKAVICLDDLERAIEKFDINDLLGAINDLVENNHFKVIVIANMEYIDQKQNDSEEKGKHEIFYEKVIEKTLHFIPDIKEVFNLLVAQKEGESNEFEKFMMHPDITGFIDPSAEKSNRIKRQKENIRTLKFAVNHFKTIFNGYISHGKDIHDEVIIKQLVNQWMFVYALSLESKRISLDINDYRGLDSYVQSASWKYNNISWGNDDSEDDLFETNEKDNENSKSDISERFVEWYYPNKESEYVFYPHIYRFIIGGISLDFKDHLEYVNVATRKFNYKTNPVQRELNRWMDGYWKMSEEEAADSLKKLAEGVKNGELVDLMSYFNASIFLQNCCGIIGMTQNDIMELFRIGLNKFSRNLELTPYLQVALNAMSLEKENGEGSVYNIIMEIIREKQEEQSEKDIEEMNDKFENDMQGFLRLFIPENGSTPKFINKAILHHLDENTLANVLRKATPNDVMCLYSLINLRYCDTFFAKLKEENVFITRLKQVARNFKSEKTTLASIIIHNQLLPILESTETKMDRICN